MSDANFNVFVDRYVNGDFVLKYVLADHEVFQEELKRRVENDIMDIVNPPKRPIIDFFKQCLAYCGDR
jgi:hypothetical protein